MRIIKMQKEIEKISILKNFWLMIKYTDKSIKIIDLLFGSLKYVKEF